RAEAGRRTIVNPYIALLRQNRNFRLLYIGQTISQLGDWFNAVAVYALLLDLTGSATAVAWMMIVQFLPVAIVGPIAGVVVDRVGDAGARRIAGRRRDGGCGSKRRIPDQRRLVLLVGELHRAHALPLDAGRSPATVGHRRTDRPHRSD